MPSQTYIKHSGAFEDDPSYQLYSNAQAREQIGSRISQAANLVGELNKMRGSLISSYDMIRDDNNSNISAEEAVITKLGGVENYIKLQIDDPDTLFDMLHDSRRQAIYDKTKEYNKQRGAYLARKKSFEKFDVLGMLDIPASELRNYPVLSKQHIEAVKAGEPRIESNETLRKRIEKYKLDQIPPYLEQTTLSGDDLPVAMPFSSTQGKSNKEAEDIQARLENELGLIKRVDKHGKIRVGAPASFERDSFLGFTMRSMQLGRGGVAWASTWGEGLKSFGAARKITRPKDYPVWNPPDDWDPVKDPWIKDAYPGWSMGGMQFTKIPRAIFVNPQRFKALRENAVWNFAEVMDSVDPLHYKDAAYKLRSYFASLEDMVRGDLMVQLENGQIDTEDLPKLYNYYMQHNLAKEVAHYISPAVLQFFGEAALDVSNYVIGPLFVGARQISQAAMRRLPQGRLFDVVRGFNNLSWFKFLGGIFDAPMYPKLTKKGEEFLLRSRQGAVEAGSGALETYIKEVPDLLGTVRSTIVSQADQDMIVDAVNATGRYANLDVNQFLKDISRELSPEDAKIFIKDFLKNNTDEQVAHVVRRNMLPRAFQDSYDALVKLGKLTEDVADQTGVLNELVQSAGKIGKGVVDPDKIGVIYKRKSLLHYLYNRGLVTSTDFVDRMPFLERINYKYEKMEKYLKTPMTKNKTVPSSALPRTSADPRANQVKHALKAAQANVSDVLPKAQLADRIKRVMDIGEEMGAVIRIPMGPYSVSDSAKVLSAAEKTWGGIAKQSDEAKEAVAKATAEFEAYLGKRREEIKGVHSQLLTRTNIRLPNLDEFIFNTEQNIGLWLSRKARGETPPAIFNQEFSKKTLKDFEALVRKQPKLKEGITAAKKKVTDLEGMLKDARHRIDEATEYHRAALKAEREATLELSRLQSEYGFKYHSFNTMDLVGTAARARVQKGQGVAETMPEFLTRITGKKVNEIMEHEIILFPEPIKEIATLTATASIFRGMPLAPIFAVGLKTGLQILKNHNKLWRAHHTVISPGYFLRDLATLPGYAFVAHGMKALNPKMHINTAKAAFLASFGGKSSRALKQTFRVLPDGNKLTYGDLLKIAKDSKFLDEFDIELRQALKEGGEGAVSDFIDRTLRFDFEGIAQMFGKKLDKKTATELRALFRSGAFAGAGMITPDLGRIIGQVISNYQKLLGLGWFIEGTDPVSIAKAVEKTGQYFGHYAKASSFEKAFLQDAFTFWNFTKFSGAYLPEMMAKHPDRMAVFQRLYNMYKNEYAAYAPVHPDGYPAVGRGSLYPAPRKFQSEWTKKFADSKYRPKPGSEEFTVMMMNSPLHLGLYAVEMADLDISSPEFRREALKMLVPLAQMGLSVWGFMDYKGDDLSKSDWFPDFTEQDWQKYKQSFGDSILGRVLISPFARVSRTFKGLIETTRGNPEVQIDHKWRAVMHNFGKFENKTLFKMAFPESKEGDDDPEYGFMNIVRSTTDRIQEAGSDVFHSGSAVFQLRPNLNYLRKLRDLEEAKAYERQLMRAGESF